MSRICMVVPGTDDSITKLLKQLSKLIYVRDITDLTNIPFINRELMLVKVRIYLRALLQSCSQGGLEISYRWENHDMK